MKCNVGWIERTVRVLIGLPIAVSYVYVRHFSMLWAYVALAAGITLLLTATAGWCPIHFVLGHSLEKPEPVADPH